jgi:hypothetical protein
MGVTDMSENEIKPVAWDMPCGGCDCGIYDAAAISAFNGDIPRCKNFERQCVGATHAALAEMGRLTAERDDALAAADSKAGWEWKKRAEKAEAERDAAVADAERYRWLRDLPEGHPSECIGNMPGDMWDSMIDEARSEGGV